jgi:hypothetical protein
MINNILIDVHKIANITKNKIQIHIINRKLQYHLLLLESNKTL